MSSQARIEELEETLDLAMPELRSPARPPVFAVINLLYLLVAPWAGLLVLSVAAVPVDRRAILGWAIFALWLAGLVALQVLFSLLRMKRQFQSRLATKSPTVYEATVCEDDFDNAVTHVPVRPGDRTSSMEIDQFKYDVSEDQTLIIPSPGVASGNEARGQKENRAGESRTRCRAPLVWRP